MSIIRKPHQAKDTTIYRGGVVFNELDTDEVRIVRKYDTKQKIWIGFKIDSRDGGETSIGIEIGPGDFPLILQEMAEANPRVSIGAMLKVIRERALRS